MINSAGRRGRVLLAVLWAVIAVVGLTACASGQPDSHYVEDTYPVAPGHLKMRPIGSGQLGSARWILRAGQNPEGQLCMGIAWRPAGNAPEDDGCGFGSNQVDDEGRGTEPVNTSENRDGAALTFGPSPAHAVKAILTEPAIKGTACSGHELDPVTVVITHRLPHWYPMHGAGWFATQTPAAAVDCPLDVRFLDRHGRTVKQPNNF